MPTYVYRCQTHGAVDVSRPMAEVSTSLPCPSCGETAPRVFTAPHLSAPRQDLVAAIDRTKQTASEPEVVSSLPSGGARRRTPTAPADPRLRRLPRP